MITRMSASAANHASGHEGTKLHFRAIAVIGSVLALIAALLVGAVGGASGAQAAPKELRTFTISSGTWIYEVNSVDWDPWYIQPSQITNGVGKINIKIGPSQPAWDVTNAKVTATKLEFVRDVGDGPMTVVLTGKNWRNYSGSHVVSGSVTWKFSNVELENPPAVDNMPRAPKSVTVAGTSTSKSFKVSWKKPSTKGDRPVAGYRVLVNQKGYKNNFVDKKLSKKTLSYKISRKTLLKNAAKRSTRGEVGGLRFRIRVLATNSAGNSKPVTKWIRVAV